MATKNIVPFGVSLITETFVDPVVEKMGGTINIWTDGNDSRDPNNEEE